MSFKFGPKIVTNGLVAYYDVGNPSSYAGSGTVWYDISGNAADATLTGSFTFLSASYGGIDFSGGSTTPSFTIPNPTITTESFAVDVWITQRLPITQSAGDYIRGIISCGDMFNSTVTGFAYLPGWCIGYYPIPTLGQLPESASFMGGGRFYSGSNSDTTTVIRIGSFAQKAVTGSSHNLFLHRNTIDQKLYFYVNGVLDASTTLLNTYSMSGSQSVINSRVWEAGSTDAPKSTFHSIKIYKNKNFTAQEVLQNYNSLKSRFGR